MCVLHMASYCNNSAVITTVLSIYLITSSALPYAECRAYIALHLQLSHIRVQNVGYSECVK